MKKKVINVVDLFAGAGGLSEGFHREGYNAIAYIEKDDNACDTLTTRHIYWKLKKENKLSIYYDYLKNKIPRRQLLTHLNGFNPVINTEISTENIPKIKDNIYRNMAKQKVASIDVFVGGPPCQAYSLVGRARDKYGMKKDPRNLLYKFYIELLGEFKPKLFVFENVPGILSAGKNKLWDNLKKDFETVGYIIDYRILDSSHFGVLQKRKRVILIGWRKEMDLQYPHFKEINHNFTVKDIFSDLPFLKGGESITVGNYSANINEYLSKSMIRNENDILIDHITRPVNEHDSKIYKIALKNWTKEGKRLMYSDLPQELKSHSNQSAFLDRFKVVADNMPYAHTIVAHIAKDGHYYIHPDIKQLRSLSVREAARVQSFPDDYKFEGSRTSKYKQIGNAVPPLLAREVAKKIKSMLI